MKDVDLPLCEWFSGCSCGDGFSRVAVFRRHSKWSYDRWRGKHEAISHESKCVCKCCFEGKLNTTLWLMTTCIVSKCEWFNACIALFYLQSTHSAFSLPPLSPNEEQLGGSVFCARTLWHDLESWGTTPTTFGFWDSRSTTSVMPPHNVFFLLLFSQVAYLVKYNKAGQVVNSAVHLLLGNFHVTPFTLEQEFSIKFIQVLMKLKLFFFNPLQRMLFAKKALFKLRSDWLLV